MAVYYNEIDRYAADRLRRHMDKGLIAPGDIDERSIEEVSPDDLRGYTQCHFFAGIGVWSHALRKAGWGDDRHVWTGSCPCQPFSAAGKGKGLDDDRHLWPAWFRLIQERRPDVVVGEQVSSKDALAWVDLVSSDLEGAGYAFGPLDTCAAGVGAPEVRQRLYWAAYADRISGGQRSPIDGGGYTRGDAQPRAGSGGSECTGFVANPNDTGLEGRAGMPERANQRPAGQDGMACGMANANGERLEGERLHLLSGQQGNASVETWRRGQVVGANPVDGFWSGADWIFCRGDQWRPVEPGTFPLAYGAPARVGRLKTYGNAIVAPVAIEFVRSVMDVIEIVGAK